MITTTLHNQLETPTRRTSVKIPEQAVGTGSPISALTAYAGIAAGRVKLIDARPSEEFRALHIPGAVNVQISQLANWARRAARRRTIKEICIYGMDAEQSRYAAHVLAAAGLANISYLDSGILGWNDARLPCVAVIDGEVVRVVIERVGLPASVLVL